MPPGGAPLAPPQATASCLCPSAGALQQGLLEFVEFQMWELAKRSHASLLEVHDGSLLRTQTDIQSARRLYMVEH